ncbi:unnamed protein product [Trichobilharzia regenti]|nr:unnamed protein product [Trichobilharzia regenti]
MDAAAMVDLALNWTNVPPQRVCEAQAPMTGSPITIRQMSKENLALTTDGCESAAALAGDLSHRVVHLEHVQAKITYFEIIIIISRLLDFTEMKPYVVCVIVSTMLSNQQDGYLVVIT